MDGWMDGGMEDGWLEEWFYTPFHGQMDRYESKVQRQILRQTTPT